MKAQYWVRRVVMFVLIGAIAILVFGGIVMLLWNNILAQVTSVQPITFVQALGILVLSKILFGGFRGAWGGRPYYWKQKMMNKWNNMTPEEREKFKQEWQRRCGGREYRRWSDRSASEESTSASERENMAGKL